MSAFRDKPAVFNIAAGCSFADALAKGVLEQAGHDPLAISEYLLLLPSRRACRTLRDAFLRLSGGQSVLLPRMQPLGDVDADEVAMLMAGEAESLALLNVPPAVPSLDRQVLLARTIMGTGIAASFDQAAALAVELGRFLDEVQSENLSFDNLQNLVPEAFSGHWQKTLEFLKILTSFWPDILSERGQIDMAKRRTLLLQAQIAAWQKHPPQHPVIAAGATGTVPIARELLGLVARLPQGQLVLPGLDMDLDDDSFENLDADHPQYNLKLLLSAAKVDRRDVKPWQVSDIRRCHTSRVRLLSEVMRPAETTEKWRQLTTGDIPPQALDGFMRIDAETPQGEADVIALIMREVLETPKKTAALITPDRRLARRVSQSLARWGIKIDDSGGQPLTEGPIGSWLMLTAEMAEDRLAPVSLLSILKHPMMAAAMPADELRRRVYVLDQLVLRGPRPAGGIGGLRQAIEAISDRKAEEKAPLLGWLDRIAPMIADFTALMATTGNVPFRQILETHIAMAEKLADTVEGPGSARLWRGEMGQSASSFLQQLRAVADDIPAMETSHYVSLLYTLLKSITVRPAYGAHPRLGILGQIEARLYTADLVILGGLNEGTWPELPKHDPWMSRPMRRDFGLPPPEKAMSLAAHDFVQGASAPEVILTRAQKVDGTPTVPARWLLRLDAVLKAVGLELPMADAKRYLQWAEDIDRPAEIRPVMRPQPAPPWDARPRKLSVTKIETWMRDPYQIYAQYVLGLSVLDPIDADPGGAERGDFVHKALEKFIKLYPDALPQDAVATLLALGRESLVENNIPPEVEAFWWPRFEKVAVFFVAEERKWRQSAKPAYTEISGRYEIDMPKGPFTLTGKADRIDRFNTGSYAIIDYKSGAMPKPTDVRQGLSPQLPLEALMLQKGAFDQIAPDDVDDLSYWHVTGSGQVPFKRVSLHSEKEPVGDLVLAAEKGLIDLINRFDDEMTPYISQPRADAKPRYSDYEHLSRVREWSVSGDEGEDAA